MKIINYSKLELKQSYGIMAFDSSYEHGMEFANTMTFCEVRPTQEKEFWGYKYNFGGTVWLDQFII